MTSDNRHKQLSANEEYRSAFDALQRGGVVALPTDTVYGLIAVAADDAAVERIYAVKARDAALAMPLLVGSVEQARLIAAFNPAGEALAAAFWPGALTLVLPRQVRYRTLAAAGGDTVAVRVPDDPVIREFASQLGPLTGTSANRSDAPECRTAAEVRAQLGDDVDCIVDAAVRAGGVASTIVDCSGRAVRILREGAVPREAIERALAGVASVG